jgi:hypothetical protein
MRCAYDDAFCSFKHGYADLSFLKQKFGSKSMVEIGTPVGKKIKPDQAISHSV